MNNYSFIKFLFCVLCLMFFSVAFIACNRKPHGPSDMTIKMEPICQTSEEQEKLALWVGECVKNANPYSDEEPEDMIYQCEKTGTRVACPKVKAVNFRRSKNHYYLESTPCDTATGTLKEFCEAN